MSLAGGGEDWLDLLEAELAEQMGADDRPEFEEPLSLAQALDPMFVSRPHLAYLSARLAQAVRDVEGGASRYLAVSMPPRLGKSQMTAVEFLVWLLHRHPGWPVMLLSHAPDLASGWGRQVRRVVEEHPELGLRIADDAGAVTDWEIAKNLGEGREAAGGGSVLSKSIRQSVTGRGAKVMVLDDIVKDFADAHSESSREFVWNWWTANSRTRLHPPSLVVVIGTRWHEDDIIGRLLSPKWPGDPSQWEVIRFPALAEDPDEVNPQTQEPYGPDALGRAAGEPLLSPLVPDETPEQALERWGDVRQGVGTYAWEAIYQQRPGAAKGTIFDSDWWQFWTPGQYWGGSTGLELDQFFDRRLTSWDCAFKGKDDSDYVVGQEWGLRGPDRFLLRQVRRRMTFTQTLEAMREFIAAAEGAGVHEHVVEDKANGTAVIDTLRTEVAGMVPYSPGQDSKEARARAASPTVESKNVYLPALADWLQDYVGEFRSFPTGANDDQVDATVQMILRTRSQGVVTAHVPQAQVTRGYQRSGAGGLRAVGGTGMRGRGR